VSHRLLCIINPGFLSYKNKQLRFEPKEGEMVTAPVEDVAIVLLDGHGLSYTEELVSALISDENAETHKKRCQEILPPEGEVRIIMMTDKQYDRMLVFNGKKKTKPEKNPGQLSFF
jgi:CRISPR-associated endonuclease Cas2